MSKYILGGSSAHRYFLPVTSAEKTHTRACTGKQKKKNKLGAITPKKKGFCHDFLVFIVTFSLHFSFHGRNLPPQPVLAMILIPCIWYWCSDFTFISGFHSAQDFEAKHCSASSSLARSPL